MAAPAPSLLILTHGGRWEGRFQVSSLAASAAATGTSVGVGLFFAALDAWVGGRWDAVDPSPPLAADAPELETYPPLTSLLAPGRLDGRIRLYACSASVRFLGLDAAAVQQKVDAIVGWPTFARLTQEASRVLSFS